MGRAGYRAALSTLCVVQITDVHLTARAGDLLCNVDTQCTLEAVLDAALAEHVDALLVTGDIVHDPLDAHGYRRFIDTVRQRFDGPIACTPGNHDMHTHMQLAGLPTDDLRLGVWHIALIDSHVDESPSADVADDQVARLEAAIADSRHVLLATHHHFFPVGCPWLDCDRIRSVTLLECATQHAAVRGVVFGHVHQEVQIERDGTWFLGAPSTCFQFEPGSQKPTLNRRPPGWRRLQLHDDGRVDTSVGRVVELSLDPIFPKK